VILFWPMGVVVEDSLDQGGKKFMAYAFVNDD
jgi:hypothetical protein